MKIEKLTENKIRITLNLNDLEEEHIDLHSFMSNSPESQALFYNLLSQAEKEVGFYTKDYKLMIEAIAIPEGNFILTITRLPEKEQSKRQVKIKRKTSTVNEGLVIYSFNSFDDYCEFCKYLSLHLKSENYLKLKKVSLCLYNSKYYLCIHINKSNLPIVKAINCEISEFGNSVNNPDLFERKLLEYGKVIFKTNAILNCVKTFL
ncbi:MAG: adaptor protein MecA [Clostridia bacterium]